MKINSAVTPAVNKQNNYNKKSNIAFKSKLISLLDGKLEKFGERLVKIYEADKELCEFPYDTFIYRQEESIVADTRIDIKGTIKDILTTKKLVDLDTHNLNPMLIMLRLNHETVNINIKPAA